MFSRQRPKGCSLETLRAPSKTLGRHQAHWIFRVFFHLESRERIERAETLTIQVLSTLLVRQLILVARESTWAICRNVSIQLRYSWFLTTCICSLEMQTSYPDASTAYPKTTSVYEHVNHQGRLARIPPVAMTFHEMDTVIHFRRNLDRPNSPAVAPFSSPMVLAN